MGFMCVRGERKNSVCALNGIKSLRISIHTAVLLLFFFNPLSAFVFSPLPVINISLNRMVKLTIR